MSSPFLFYLGKFPSTMNIRRGSGPNAVRSLSSIAQSVRNVGQSTLSSKDLQPSIKLPLLCDHNLSRVASGDINLRQTTSPAASKNVVSGLGSTAKLYPTDCNATEASVRRWKTWSSYPNPRRKQIKQYFGLPYISRILDEIIFRGQLGNHVLLRWVERLDCSSRTTLISDAKRGPHILIEVMKPITDGPWTPEIMQQRLEAVLSAMTNVAFQMYIRDCVPFQQMTNRAAKGRKSGYDSLYRKFLRGVEQEANLKLKGLPRLWDLHK